MKNFYHLLSNTLIAMLTTNFVWFSLIYWAYLETQSVLATSIMGGLFLVATALSSFWFGSIVDHHKKKIAMFISSAVTLTFFGLALAVYLIAPEAAFKTIQSPWLAGFVLLLLVGTVFGNIRNIVLPTATTILVDADKRDKANGMSGTVLGISFMAASIASGLLLGLFGMGVVLTLGVILTALAIIHLMIIPLVEPEIIHTAEKPKKVDLKGTIKAIKEVPGLFGLIFFNCFNNFLGGVFMALMDPYGLTLVSVEVWGTLWGILSTGFIISGIIIAKKGVGKKPLLSMFRGILLTWLVAMVFTIQPSIILLSVGVFAWIFLVPFIEASEQTVIQKVVPVERQGRIFGFSQSLEMSAAPVTAFLIGPLAQYVFIPFMTEGRGVDLIGSWFGVGPGRGMALVFVVAGLIGTLITVYAMNSRVYRLLSAKYEEQPKAA